MCSGRSRNAAYRYQRAIEKNESVVVGVNRYQSRGGISIPIHRVDPAVEQAQVERLRALRQRRDTVAAETALVKLEEAARGTANLLPRILTALRHTLPWARSAIACVRCGASIGKLRPYST